MSNNRNSYTDDEIYRMRQFLARRWNQSISQVTDAEARAYLDYDREVLEAKQKSSPATPRSST